MGRSPEQKSITRVSDEANTLTAIVLDEHEWTTVQFAHGPSLEQLRPETVDRLAQKAQAEGLSLDAYLNALVGLLSEGTALTEISEAEFEAFIEDFSKGSEQFPPLPPDFSRADIYTDHD
jgi:hypothetical protein